MLGACFALGCAAAANAPAISAKLSQLALDPAECYRVHDLSIAREDLRIYLNSGYLVVAKDIEGRRVGAAFSAELEGGDAEILLIPPDRGERRSLARFTERPNLDEHFTSAVFVFSSDAGRELAELAGNAKKAPEAGVLLASTLSPVLRNLGGGFQVRLASDLLAPDPAARFFYMAAVSPRLGNIDVLYDARSGPEITLGQLKTGADRTYFDIWTSFPARSARKSPAQAAGNPQFALSNFRIEATIGTDLSLAAKTRATLQAVHTAQRVVTLLISRRMAVTAVSIDGKPAEVFQRESLRSRLIGGTENEEFLVIAPKLLEPGRDHELVIEHNGSVISRAGDNVFLVGARGGWYPQLRFELARFDLTFRYPKALTLVATGARTEERLEGEWRIDRYQTDAPIRFAGFNLGEYQRVTLNRGDLRVEVNANRKLDNAVQRRALEVAPLTVGPPGHHRIPSTPPPDLFQLTPDPAAQLRQLGGVVMSAFEFMAGMYGAPPLHSLTISPIPAGFGQGFPGLVYLSTLAYLDPARRAVLTGVPATQAFSSELLEAHEVAHQWWGNLVVPATYKDEWISEALANYSALLYLEKKHGPKALDAVLDQFRQDLAREERGHTVESAGPITWGYRLQSSQSPRAWHVITYEKGAWIIHMLRKRLGDEKFLSTLRSICDGYRFQPFRIADFERAFAAKIPLEGFFESWVFDSGMPVVKLQWSHLHGKVTGTLRLQDAGEDFTAAVPVQVQFARAKPALYWLPASSEGTPFRLSVAQPPTRVFVDTTAALVRSKN